THLEEAGISKKTPLSPQPESPAIPPSKGKTLLEKEEAMNLLLDAEKGDAQGAGADFSLVAKSAGHGGETLREAAEQFARLLEVEGCSQTTKAQEDYALIDGTLKPGQKRAEAVTQFLRLADAENDTSQARGDFALLQRNLPSGTTLTRATSQFLSLLNCEGAENTVDVQADFRTIQQSLKEGETWEAAFEQFRRLYDMELNRSFALEDFAVISETLKKGESRKMATDQFIRLYDAEQSRRDAISDYRLIRRVAGQDSLEEGTTRFLKLLNKAGSDNTAAVQGSFNLLYQ
ncbi:MAG: hypothetical protein HYU64_20050, partial [Armatimonadetes bacterium]|nr:hypothetical protein [Armatimonadota bacterium]